MLHRTEDSEKEGSMLGENSVPSVRSWEWRFVLTQVQSWAQCEACSLLGDESPHCGTYVNSSPSCTYSVLFRWCLESGGQKVAPAILIKPWFGRHCEHESPSPRGVAFLPHVRQHAPPPGGAFSFLLFSSPRELGMHSSTKDEVLCFLEKTRKVGLSWILVMGACPLPQL